MGSDQSVIDENGNLENDQIQVGKEKRGLARRFSSFITKKNQGENKVAFGEILDNLKVLKPSTSDPVNEPAPLPAPIIQEPPSQVPSSEPAQDQVVEEHKDEHKSDASSFDSSKYAVNYEHVHETIIEFADSCETTDKHSALNLLDVFEKMKVTDQELSMWQVGSKNNAKNRMKSVLEYAENNSRCSPDVKTKLRILTKMILEGKKDKDKQEEFKAILLVLASHGNVCHVMKEVAINNAYFSVTNRLDEYVESQSLQQQILSVLRDLRVLLVERVFHDFKFCNNTHYIAGFHNQMAKQIGVKEYNDPDICYPSSSKNKNWRQGLDQRFMKEYYTKESIVECVLKQIEEKKISYQKIVAFFEEKCPKDQEKTEWLSTVINIDNGEIRQEYLFWMLDQLDVLLVKDDQWKEIEKCWDDIKH